ncbi:hypothetical protein [Tenacibaculum jejuense]|uniref:Probable lipoprotein n=1 Tax=Tenacibaculum jejuense TaxID=584609 RepID=A0A238UAT6_9FLAO|nr:hypothetical protein [Tenacibaculum jejuense]SNR16185.1 Probable lipoprotein precursor [Tenacibaculum jejuense]
MKKLILGVIALAFTFTFTSCNDDEEVVNTEAGTLNGGPFTFFVDGKVDNVSGVTVTGNIQGSNTSFIVTDDTGLILGLPGDITALEGVNFDGAGVGKCYIWHIAYEDGLSGLEVGENANDLTPGNLFDLSNNIEVNREGGPVAGTLTGGPFIFAAGDGNVDNVSGVAVTGSPEGSESSFIVTDEAGMILGLPGDIATLEGVDFDGAGVGKCLIWYIRYEGSAVDLGLEMGKNANDLNGVFSLSNSIDVDRVAPPVAGMLTGGPYQFGVGDGIADNVSNVMVTGNPVGSKSSFIVTDDAGMILGLPADMTALEGVDFDGAGVGKCLIWYIRYEGELEGLAMGENANNIEGIFSLSNSIDVDRVTAPVAGMLTGGPFTFVAGDGMVDNVSGIAVTGSPVGTNRSFIVTDDAGMILGLPGDMTALQGVNFDGAGVGKCLIWYIRYEDGLEGLEMNKNANDLKGVFALSNSIDVDRVAQPEAGMLTGGPFNFTAGDGMVDNVSGVAVTGNPVGSKSSFIVTDDAGMILGLPGDMTALEGVNFDGAGVGKCLIWYIRYEGDLEGLEVGKNASTDLNGIFDLSNSIDVNRN